MRDPGKIIWFEPRRYGYGARPVTWQGWTITFGFIVFALAVLRVFKDDAGTQMVIIFPAIAILLIVTAKTTRGGWRWRWGDVD